MGRLGRGRRAWLTAAGLVAAALAVLAFAAVHWTPVDRGFKSFRLAGIRTEAGVEAVLGPPGDYSTARRVYGGIHAGPLPKGRLVTWTDDYAKVLVYFSPDGLPAYWYVWPVTEDNRTWAQRLRDRFDDQFRWLRDRFD